ncbi:hypothetical protein HHK36_033006 [Tetracentron sinense]|uniref:Uncharacterized protein n=1 Tax=Tetracentron sinense TaxID=13715 RepID=A0A834Y5X5_TETSI|nr:hypothetical protein HHK36_033006 [Tetracentron sinense]
MKKSMFYEMTLEQKWEQIYECENNQRKTSSVAVDVVVQREMGMIYGREAVKDDTNVVDGVVWFRTLDNVGGHSVGLSLAIVERMKWEQERGGWIGGNEKKVRVERVEEFGGESGWSKFGCYILVERQFPSSLSLSPPEGPNTGYLAIQDEESVETQCFGLCKKYPYVKDLPFPQNKRLTIEYTTGGGGQTITRLYKVFLIPVLDQPLSSKYYYVIQGRHQGKHTQVQKKRTRSPVVSVVSALMLKMKNQELALDQQDIYQQIEITHRETSCGIVNGGFVSKSLAPDGFPPEFLRNNQSKTSFVAVDVVVQREMGMISGREAVKDFTNVVDGVVWFRIGGLSVGLSLAIVERMKWEQERGEWIGGNERQVRVERVEEFEGDINGWSKFGCYILVERFCLSRNGWKLVVHL